VLAEVSAIVLVPLDLRNPHPAASGAIKVANRSDTLV
jgi:hypothetical protein